jgi:chromosome segregation ATPase
MTASETPELWALDFKTKEMKPVKKNECLVEYVWAEDYFALERRCADLTRQLAECQKECAEQARLNGAGASREAALEAKLAEANSRWTNMIIQRDHYKDKLAQAETALVDVNAIVAVQLTKLAAAQERIAQAEARTVEQQKRIDLYEAITTGAEHKAIDAAMTAKEKE